MKMSARSREHRPSVPVHRLPAWPIAASAAYAREVAIRHLTRCELAAGAALAFPAPAAASARYASFTIGATLDGGPSSGRAKTLNAQVSALITRARGFRSATALMNMILFVHGGICPASPYA